MRMGWCAVMVAWLLSAGCEKGVRDMYNQPRYAPYDSSEFFPDGASARRPVDGTIVRTAGPLAGASSGRQGIAAIPQAIEPVIPITVGQGNRQDDRHKGGWPPDLRSLPVTVNQRLLARGRQRFAIHCSPCHSLLGDGEGIVAQRGFPNPPSFHSDRLRQAPNEHFFNVISNGYGVMYAYADHLDVADRWAVVAYIRALQLGQYADAEALPAAQRKRLQETAP